MEKKNELITIAVHTHDKARDVRTLLEREGVECYFHSLDPENPDLFPGVRVRVKRDDLMLALRIIENSEIFIMPEEAEAEAKREILFPTDFSDYSLNALNLAFDLASRLQAKIKILHTYLASAPLFKIQISASISLDPLETTVEEKEEGEELKQVATTQMRNFTDRLREKIKRGELPPVPFSTEIVDSLPEEGILNYARQRNPLCIVMGTRGAERKEKELLGSISAEVQDGCRIPVITVPETTAIEGVNGINRVVFITSLEQDDILALDTLNQLFAEHPLDITLLYFNSKKRTEASTTRVSGLLLDYYRQRYPLHQFSFINIEPRDAVIYFGRQENGVPVIDLIAVPNKKKHLLSRLFNPSLAHRLIFKADIPLLALPL